MKRITLLAALTLVATAALRAQSNPSVHWGDRVRVRVTCRVTPCDTAYLEGFVASSSADTLTLQDNGLNRTFHIGDLERLEIAVWRHHNRTAQGAMIGLLSGAIGGWLLGTAASPPTCPDGARNGFFCGEGMRDLGGLFGALVGGLGGTLVGAAIGSAASSTGQTWQRIPLSHDPHSSPKAVGPVHLGFSIAF